MDELKDVARGGAMKARAVWRFFPAQAEGNRVTLRDPDTDEAVASWDFPRQSKNGGLCLADYVLPADHVALFVTTAGDGVRERVEEWKHRGEYLKSHAFAALALETAEAAAEYLHACLRRRWGFPDAADLPMEDQLAARYRGKRYSFGYPACPDLAFQRELFRALRPEEDRRPPDRGGHDGSRGERVGAGVSPPGRAVFRGLISCRVHLSMSSSSRTMHGSRWSGGGSLKTRYHGYSGLRTRRRSRDLLGAFTREAPRDRRRVKRTSYESSST